VSNSPQAGPPSLDPVLALLAEDDPRDALDRGVEALATLLSCRPNRARLDRLVAIETELLFEWDPVRRLAALLPDDSVQIAALAARLGAAPTLTRRLCAAVSEAGIRIVSYLSPRETRRVLYRLGAETFRDRVVLAWADSTRTAATPQWHMLLAYAEVWTPPEFTIGDRELAATGVPPGPLAAQIRQELEAWWIDHDFIDDQLAAIERLKALVQGLLY
jgi:poly(A) polymerase